MSDLAERLRKEAREGRYGAYDDMVPVTNDSYICMCEEAADEIERLRKSDELLKKSARGVAFSNMPADVQEAIITHLDTQEREAQKERRE